MLIDSQGPRCFVVCFLARADGIGGGAEEELVAAVRRMCSHCAASGPQGPASSIRVDRECLSCVKVQMHECRSLFSLPLGCWCYGAAVASVTAAAVVSLVVSASSG